MSIDTATVRHVARLARLALSEDETEAMRTELNQILAFVEQLAEVHVEGVPAMTAVIPSPIKMRKDVVTEGNNAEAILANAPGAERNFFLVPKVIE
jgi:aspartyl-tRNA(Asn)/glutamyl-tRNA(Gln) amidotransferase subunit C